MTPRERVAAAMRHEIPDRVPVMCQMSMGHMYLQSGCSPLECWHDTATYVAVLFQMRERYDFDGILVSVPGSDPSWRDKIEEVQPIEDGYVVTWREEIDCPTAYPIGLKTLYRNDDLPEPMPRRPPADPASFDPDTLETETPDWMLANLRAVIERNQGKFSIHGETFSPFDKVVDTFGQEGAMLALLDAPEVCKAILERGVQYCAYWGLAQAKCGCDALKISSPYVGGGLLSPRMYEEFVVPYERAMIEQLHAGAPGVPVYTHTCGAIGDRLELMASSGTDGLECLDPPPLGDVELADAKRRVGDRMFIKGNIDSVNTLLNKDLRGIEEDVRAALAAGMPGGGYILSTACSIAPQVSAEKIQALTRFGHEFGRYA